MIDDPNIAIPQTDPTPQAAGNETAHGQADAASQPAGALSTEPLARQDVAAETVSLPPTEAVPSAARPEEPAATVQPRDDSRPAEEPAEEVVRAEEMAEGIGGAAAAEAATAAETHEQQPQETAEPTEVAAPEAPPAASEPPVDSPAAAEAQPAAEGPKSEKMDWYILKVQSNREESIRDGLKRRVAIAGLDSYFGDVIIPTEKVTEFKGGKRKVFKRKLYPGYLVVQMEINEDTWFLVRETPGIGDFTGAAGHPTPMQAREVAAIRAKQEEKTDEAPRLKINFKVADHVKIKEGTFENFEGEVANIDETNGRVTVLINIFGRSTPVDIEYWQIEAV